MITIEIDLRERIFVVSLPRTGTKSMCQMLKNLGYKVQHAPGPSYHSFLDRVDAVADTPGFMPSLVKEMIDKYPNGKFIYIDKDASAWVESMVKTGLSKNYNDMLVTPRDELSPHNIVDLDSLAEVMDNQPFNEDTALAAFKTHKEFVKKAVPKKKLLVYKFSKGWKPLCKFLSKDLPENLEIPHLNKDTMFDDLI